MNELFKRFIDPSLRKLSIKSIIHPTIPHDWISSTKILHRFIHQLPLLIVLLILLWAQYTITISLILNYLIYTRRLNSLAISIWIPFNLFWSSSLINLLRCIITGPGYVQKFPHLTTSHQSISQSELDLEHHPLDHQLPSSSSTARASVQATHPVKPYLTRTNLLESSNRLDPPDLDLDDDDHDDGDDDIPSEAHDQGSVPLLSRNYRPTSSSNFDSTHPVHPTPDLLPRPALTSISPPSYVDPSTIPISHLSFQQQVQRQQQIARPHHSSDLFNALDFPPTTLHSTTTGGRTSSQRPPRIETLMCKSDGSLRFCRKCDHYKADRSHHCSSCGRCVLRMDHHCPWLGGRCVGLKNHKFFILFLVSTSVTAILAAIAAGNGLMDFVSNTHLSSQDRFELGPLNWAFMILVGGLFGMVLTGFTSYHLYLLSVNRTTIENMERSLRVRPTATNDTTGGSSYALLRTTRLKPRENLTMQDELVGPTTTTIGITVPRSSAGGRRTGEDEERQEEEAVSARLPSYNLPIYKSDDRLTRAERRKLELGSTKLNLFDLGNWYENFQQVFGPQSPIYEWFLPIHPRGISDGYHYRINQENLRRLVDLTSEIRLLPNERLNELRFERP